MTTEKIISTISLIRLESYKTAFSLNSHSEAIGMYIWNKELCSVFFPILQLLEVSLRNSICIGYINHQKKILTDGGMQVDDLERNIDYNWLQNFFLSTTSSDFSKTKAAVQSVINELNNHTIPITSDNIVSKLSFGVWSNICTERHSDDKSDSLRIWPALLRYVFPGKVVSLKQIENDVKKINYLRNRIAHHEPIWKKKGNFTIEQHINAIINYAILCIDFINYINPSNLKVVEVLHSLKQIEHLCKKETIDSYVATGKDISIISPYDLNTWMKNNIINSRIDGELTKIKKSCIIVKSPSYPDIEFLLDKNSFFDKKINKEIGQKVNFEPIERGNTYMATKVKAL